MNIREYLKTNRLITDGAMGTYYEQQYGEEHTLAELMNTQQPDRIRQIHMEYMEAGAKLIRTNTFASNSMFLDTMAEIEENVAAGYRIAREAVEQYQSAHQAAGDIYIAADLGTIYDSDHEEYEHVLEEYKGICDVFIREGARIFLFETQSDFLYIEPVAAYIKEQCEDEVFVIAQFSFDKSGYTKSGLSVKKVVGQAAALADIDAYGMNCGVEATHMYELMKEIIFPNEKYITALPNAGYPYTLRGRTIYSNNAEYYVEKMAGIAELGMDIVGGCCGTTPEHIQQLCRCLEGIARQPKRIDADKSGNASRAGSMTQTESAYLAKLEQGKKTYIVELDPPFQADISKVLKGAEELAHIGVDLITLSDSPLARTRMDAGQLAVKLQSEVGVPVMPHVSCRDRNVIAMRSMMLGTHMNGIRHYLIVTGDPVARGDRERITSVYDFNSIKLMQYVQEMNGDVFEGDHAIYGGALNYNGVNADAIVRRMKLKMESGCSMFLTQPVYSMEDVERLRYLKKETGAKMMCGIMPIVSYKNAMFLQNEMPGIDISEETVARYQPDMTREEAEAVATEVSVELAEAMYDFADGYYFMTPFNRTGLIANIIETIRSHHQGD